MKNKSFCRSLLLVVVFLLFAFQATCLAVNHINATFSGSGDCNLHAYPENPLPAKLFSSVISPPSPQPDPAAVQVEAGAAPGVMITPTIQVPAADIGNSGQLLLYIYVPSVNFGINIPGKTVTLASEQLVDLIPDPLDFTDYQGLDFIVYYGYVKADGTIMYNVYTVSIIDCCENILPSCAGLSQPDCEAVNNCVWSAFPTPVCMIDCNQFEDQESCANAFDGDTCKWLSTPLGYKCAHFDEAGVDLRYEVTIDEPEKHSARVRLEVSNITDNNLPIVEREGSPLYGINVTKFKAENSAGDFLDVKFTEGDDDLFIPDRWEIEPLNTSNVILSYDVEMTKTSTVTWGRPAYLGYLSNDFAVLLGAYLFLTPDDSVAVKSIKIKFDVPENWEILTPWKKVCDEYEPINFNHPRELDRNPYPLFNESVLAFGRFETSTKAFGKSSVTVAVFEDWPEANKNRLFNTELSIYEYMHSIWGDVAEPYLAVFCPQASDGLPIYGGTGSYGIIFALENDDVMGSINYDPPAVELAETRWTGYLWGIGSREPECRWYYYGVAKFYSIKTLLKKFILKDAYSRIFLDFYNDYLEEFSNNDPRPKGTFATFLIAKEIYLRTEGKFTIDDLSKVLFQKYWGGKENLNNERFKEELKILTGIDFSEFIDEVLYGDEPLNIDWAYLDDDGDGLANGEEIFWNSNPNALDSDNDGINDLQEVLSNSDPSGSLM